MPRTWILVDLSYLAYRAFYSTGELAFGDVRTGVVYGVLREIHKLMERFGSSDFVFCCDQKPYLRCAFLAGYKDDSDDDEEKREQKRLVRDEVRKLRELYLPALGYHNIFRQKGYEADDVIASVIRSLKRTDKVVIVSGDHDLYQLLAPEIVIYRPREVALLDEDVFRDVWKISPAEWPMVKAISGCRTDNVPGLDGVGDVLAAKYLSGQMNKKTKTWNNIDLWVAHSADYYRNLGLIRLPYSGVDDFVPEPGKGVRPAKWEALMKKLGIYTLPVPGSDGAADVRVAIKRNKL